jgi:trigger factor
MKEVFTAKKVGERLVANVFELEEKGDEKYVRKYFLGLEEEDDREVNPTFELTIEEASRIEEAQLDEKFFQGYFGEETEVTSEEEAREKIRENIAGYYNKQAEALLFRDMQEDLMEKNKPALPNDFLKRWILASNEEATPADVDKEFDTFTENLRWTLVRNRLVERFELKVEQDEIMEGFKDRVRGYLAQNPGMMDDSFIDQMAMRLMQDQKQVEQIYDELLTDKLYDALVEVVTVKDKPIAMDEFLTIAQEAQQKAQQQSAAPVAEEEE